MSLMICVRDVCHVECMGDVRCEMSVMGNANDVASCDVNDMKNVPDSVACE